ncbi:MAG: Heparinase family protein [Betaproteobacteria bacterium]|nr:Heparinase family protein [Betaproteobacteria bacterium]
MSGLKTHRGLSSAGETARSPLSRGLLYFHTLRHLRPIQVWGRLRFRLSRPTPDLSKAPGQRAASEQWTRGAVHPQRQLSPTRFRFLNVEHEISAPDDWNAPQRPKLWLYNAHYFDDLAASDALARREWHGALIERWIGENPPGQGVGWEPYPISCRIVNWIRWALAGNVLTANALHSLAVQSRFLSRRLEWHLLGNHLFVNAKALVFAGVFFEGAEADRWRRMGLAILMRELPEQILADGGHFERSPMYHALILEDVLDLVNLERAYPKVFAGSVQSAAVSDAWIQRIPAMLGWLSAMSHPDGDIAFFNDAAFQISAEPQALADYAARLGITPPPEVNEGMQVLGETGYVAARRGPISLWFDAAPLGPEYLPAHAHADTLSFELSWHGQRIVTNSGTSCYASGPQRDWERSTAAHNAVVIDGESSSEVWHAFRVARRARPFALHCGETAQSCVMRCSHDGYTRLPGRPVHTRTIELTEREVTWRDEVTGSGTHAATGYIPLHPSVTAEQTADGSCALAGPEGLRLALTPVNACTRLHIDTGTYSAEFGHVLPRPVLMWTLTGRLPLTAVFRLREL